MDWVEAVVDRVQAVVHRVQGVVDWVQAVIDRVQGMMDEGWRVMVKLRGQAEGQDMGWVFAQGKRWARKPTNILRTSDRDASIRQYQAVGVTNRAGI